MNNAITIQTILEQLNKIIASSEYIHDALIALKTMECPVALEAYAPSDIANQARAEGIANIVAARETTNQQLIRFYERMYCDLVSTANPADRPIDSQQA